MKAKRNLFMNVKLAVIYVIVNLKSDWHLITDAL
jgi:hypothetical protein